MQRARTKWLCGALAIGLAACQPAASGGPSGTAPHQELVSSLDWSGCINDAAKAIVAAKARDGGIDSLYGHHKTLDGEVSRACRPGAALSPGEYAYVNAAVENQVQAKINGQIANRLQEQRKQTGMDAPRLAVEKTEEDRAMHKYWSCLARHSRIMALNSSESTEIIAMAAFPSCIADRQAALDAFRGHSNQFSPDAMKVTDGVFYNRLLLEVIQARAETPAPAPTPPRGPDPTKRITPL